MNDEFDLVEMLEVEVGWQLDFYVAQSHERPLGVFLPELILVKPMEGTSTLSTMATTVTVAVTALM